MNHYRTLTHLCNTVLTSS